MTQSRRFESQMSQAEPVVILGMHRSGTSLVTRLLIDVGIYMGSRLSVNAEPPFFQKLNQSIFASAGATWSNVEPMIEAMASPQFVERQAGVLEHILLERNTIRDFFGAEQWPAGRDLPLSRWGWKDPRTTLTFPIWLSVFPHARFVHVLRNGVDVAISIHRRTCMIREQWWKWWWYQLRGYGTSTLNFQHDLELWERYVSFALEEKKRIAPERYYEVRYEALLDAPEAEVRGLLAFLDVQTGSTTVASVARQVETRRTFDARYAANYVDEIQTFASRQCMQQLGYQPPRPAGGAEA
ncbi:MAG: sulfotransferase [Anaerolineae bacterium]|nr:sulfotransferase [Anaerolineae bacterium]